MATRLPLGYLDLSKRRAGATAQEAVRQTLVLAQRLDALGFQRFWLAEHHVEDTAASAPEVLLGAIAVSTRTIRLGFGGIVINYYSPYRAVEIACSLQAIAGPRIDLGLCRGPGLIDRRIAEELVCENRWELQRDVFERKVYRTRSFLQASATTMTYGPPIYPTNSDKPALWILASSRETATLAAEIGSAFAAPLFITGDTERTLLVTDTYLRVCDLRQNGPCLVLAVSVIAAETMSDAHLRHEATLKAGSLRSNLVGDFASVAQDLLKLKAKFKAEEILIVSFSLSLEERLETVERLSDIILDTNEVASADD